MADDENLLSVNFDELGQGGDRLKHISQIAGELCKMVRDGTDGRDLGGNGDIGRLFRAFYYPAAKAGNEFLAGIAAMLGFHGNKTTRLGGMFGDVNDTTTNEASGGTGHRR